jgi:acyl-CoA synthetase (AMP-forming)/AMP-acid ligase II
MAWAEAVPDFQPVHLAWLAAPGDDGILLEDERGALSAAAFGAEVAALAAFLAGRGIGAGDVVATMLPNRIEIVVAMFAAWRLGAALTPVNPALTAGEAGFQLRDSNAKLVIVDEAAAATLAATDAALVPAGSRAAEPAPTSAAPAPGDTALLIYTSGTTGRPKGVMLSHRNIDAMVRSIHRALPLADSRALLVMPLFHVNALLVSVLAPLAAGGAVRVLDRFDRHGFWQSVRDSRATYFSGVPAMYLLLAGEAGPIAPAPDLRFAVCGAAPMPAEAIAAFEARYGVPILEGYGLTESTVGATLNPIALARRPGSVGRAMPGISVAIMDDEGRRLPAGAVGEVVIRGDTVMKGYLGRPEETAAAIVDGWLRTGDLGRLDAEGWLTLVGRKKDLIIRGGENIYPVEIENALLATGIVAEAAVVGRPDAVMGEVPVAFASVAASRPLADAEAALRAAAARTLAGFKRPVAYYFVEGLPRNPIGKIDKPALRARLAATDGKSSDRKGAM